MKRLTVLMVVVSIVALTAGCSFKGKYHDTSLPDPKQYNAHFGDMDSKKDGRISWEEFKAYFPQAEPKVFSTTMPFRPPTAIWISLENNAR